MRFAILAALLLAAACTTEEQPPVQEPVDLVDPNCSKGEELLPYVGGPVSAFDTVGYGKPVRVIPPGALVTQELVPERVNLETDGAGTITRIWCG